MGLALAWVAAVGLGAPPSARALAAQAPEDSPPGNPAVLRGQVVDAADESTPVGQALVRLVDGEGTQVAVDLSDSEGWYQLTVPGPDEYTIEAEAFGWLPYTSAPFRMAAVAGDFRVDLLLEVQPVEIPGLTVDVDRTGQVERDVQLMIGVSTKSLRQPVLHRRDILEHAERNRNLPDLMRWEGFAGVLVRETASQVCFDARGRCLPLYVNGLEVDADLFAAGIPLEMLGALVVVMPGESTVYGGGAVLLYSEHWLR